MFSRVPSFRRFALAGLVLAAAGQASAQLANKSPFLPPQAAAAGAATAGAPLEYRGYIETGGGLQFRIYDPAKKMGAWVKVNERHLEFDLTVKQHDEGQKTLTVEYQGKSHTLAERVPKVVSSGTAMQAMPPPIAPAPTNVAAAVTQSVVLNPTPADEQRRLDAVAAEVARRRALREQATQQMSQGAAPQMSVPQGALPQAGPPLQNLPAARQGNPPLLNNPNVPRGRGPAEAYNRQQ